MLHLLLLLLSLLSPLVPAHAFAPPKAAFAAHGDPRGASHGPHHPAALDRFRTDRPRPLLLPLPREEDSYHFAVFGDRTGGPAEGIAVLEQAVADANLLGPDLVMTVGDLIQGYNTEEPWLAQMREYRAVMGKLEMPWFPVAGNHDVYWRGEGRPEEEHEGNYERHFGPLWYAFRHKDCWFFALYTDEPDPATGERNFRLPASQRMSAEQFAWLDRTLEEARGAQAVFVFVHHPRWMEDRYGGDWERVHRRLAQNGNVRAVFGGHIHRMDYRGPRDGIEYFTLATVGGHQEGLAPAAGYLHQYHVVTVRRDSLHVVAYPVGAALDPRAITPMVSAEAARFAGEFAPAFSQRPAIASDGNLTGAYQVALKNPCSMPLELEVSLRVPDGEWRLAIDHHHVRVEPGASVQLEFPVARHYRGPGSLVGLPRLSVAADLLGPTARFALPTRQFETPLPAGDPEPWMVPQTPRVLALDGQSAACRVPHGALGAIDGPFTLECWFLASGFAPRQGLVGKMQQSEFGFFTSEGRLSFSVHLDGRYVRVEHTQALELGRWYHAAGVFDGQSVSLWVDGKPSASRPGSGARTPNRLPLVVGGDVDGSGNLDSPFRGQIDGVRLSKTARYREAFAPERHPKPDAQTLLLLDFDRSLSQPGERPRALDRSDRGAHGELLGSAALVPGSP